MSLQDKIDEAEERRTWEDWRQHYANGPATPEAREACLRWRHAATVAYGQLDESPGQLPDGPSLFQEPERPTLRPESM